MSVPPESVTPPPPNDPSQAGLPVPDQRQWAMFAHLSALAGLVMPFGSILGPLIVWLIKKDTMPLVNDQGKEALNFQIFLAIVYVVGIITSVFVIGIFILLAGWILAIVFRIQGAMTANRGEPYRYPLTWRVIH